MSSLGGKWRPSTLFFQPHELGDPDRRFEKSLNLFLLFLTLTTEALLVLFHFIRSHGTPLPLHTGVLLILVCALVLFKSFFTRRIWTVLYLVLFYCTLWIAMIWSDPWGSFLWLVLLPPASFFLLFRWKLTIGVWVLCTLTAVYQELECPAWTIRWFLIDHTVNSEWALSLNVGFFSLTLTGLAYAFFRMIRGSMKTYHQQKSEVFDLLKKSRESEEKFVQQINFLQTLMDLIPFPLFSKDLHGHFLSCNPAFSVVFDISREKVFGATTTEVFSSANAQTMEKIELEVFSREIMAAEEVSLIHADGQKHDFIVYFMPFLGIDQQMEGYIGVLIDISERKEKELKLLNLNATKDQLFSIISHDLRGPVGKIKQLLDLYVEDRKIFDEATWAQVFDDMRKSSDSLYLLLENLLAWARAQKGDYQVRPEVFPLEPMVAEVFSLQKLLSNDKKIRMVMEVKLHGQMLSDKAILSTILRNLIHNAVKFTPEGGRVTVSADEDPDEVRICVSDTGVGIPGETLKKIFLRQERITTHGTAKEKGQGIGLGLCIDLAGLIGGRLTAQSTPGAGTSFTLTLPTPEL